MSINNKSLMENFKKKKPKKQQEQKVRNFQGLFNFTKRSFLTVTSIPPESTFNFETAY